MIIGRYRITKRGYVVFGSFGIILLLLIGFTIRNFSIRGEENSQTGLAPNTEQTQTESQNNAQTNTSTTGVPGNAGTSNVSNAPNATQAAPLSTEEVNKILSAEETVIYFLPDDYELDTANYTRLDELVALSIRFKNAKILIDGHYNGYPDFKVTEFWTSLAQNRAEMIEAYFVSQGIEQSRITIINKGCSEPVNQDDSWQEIQKNRRVVIHFELTNQ